MIDKVDEIFALPNTIENLVKKKKIIDYYKEVHYIPKRARVNILNVMQWAKRNGVLNED